jgi:metal-sulfur cluster biosynthetic enzyme
MRYQINISVLLCLTGLLLSCQQNAPSPIVYELSFAEIAQLAATKNRSFAIVLTNPECPPCGKLQTTLHEELSKVVGKKNIFNVVDITLPQNRWYQQLMSSMAQPTTLIFTPDAKLIAIIQGAITSSVECIKSTTDGEPACAQYQHTLEFTEWVPYEDLMQKFNTVLLAKQKVENREDAIDEFDEIFNALYYPYVLWLKMQNEQNLGNSDDAIDVARQMLTFQDPYHLRLYSDLFLDARKVINPDFDIAIMPLLEIENSSIDLGDILEGNKVEIRIKMTNGGKETLFIHNIGLSCSCLTALDEYSNEIVAGDETYLHLLFTAEQPGEIQRDVQISYNGLMPIKTINIKANVW